MILSTIILVSWLIAIVYTVLAIIGYLINRTSDTIGIFGNNVESGKIIFQITTIGNDMVEEIIRQIRGYELSFPNEIWVVHEPFDTRSYSADVLVTMPYSFIPPGGAKYKARAMEYARLVRMNMVGNRLPETYKVIFIDDDSIPSREFIIDVWNRSEDMLEGYVQSGNNYGTILSYVENIRGWACLTTCALFQGTSHPAWIHGEALSINDRVDKAVSWDKPVIASEDLVYGQAAIDMGFKMGFTYSPINVTAPLDVGDYIIQKRRWMWGNFHAIKNILSWTQKIKLITLWVVGLIILPISVMGAALTLLGYLTFSLNTQYITALTLISWLALWGIVGYRVRHNLNDTIISIALAYPSVVFYWIMTMMALIKGPIKRFEVIQKQESGSPFD